MLARDVENNVPPLAVTSAPASAAEEQSRLDLEDDLDEAERGSLHEALQASAEDVATGRLVDAEEILAELRGDACQRQW